MTLEAEIGIPRDEHLLVHGAVRIVASRAAFAHGFVLENEWATLLAVTLHAGIVGAHKRDTAAFDGLLQTCPTALNRFAYMRVMAVRTTHLSFEHRVMVWERELRTQIEVTLEASVRRFARIDDLAFLAAG